MTDAARTDPKTEALIRKRFASPTEALLREIKGGRWTAHNIPLTFSESTMGDQAPLIGDDLRTRVIKDILQMLLHGALSGVRLADLGCLEGGLAFEMARLDMEVLGIEGRRSNYAKCRLIEEYFGLPNLRFIHLDVKNLTVKEHGTFDVIICCGLLYHLDDPFSFLQILRNITHDGSVLFLETHYSPPNRAALEACAFKDALSETESFAYGGHTYRGRWYSEFDEGGCAPDEPWTACSNYRSFWPEKDSLLRALYHSGFRKIFDLYGGCDIEQEFALREKYSRFYCVAIRGEYFERP